MFDTFLELGEPWIMEELLFCGELSSECRYSGMSLGLFSSGMLPLSE